LKKPKTDICEACDRIYLEIKNKQKTKELESVNKLKNELFLHQNEAQIFYDLKKKVKN
jgi:hypothetical protein